MGGRSTSVGGATQASFLRRGQLESVSLFLVYYFLVTESQIKLAELCKWKEFVGKCNQNSEKAGAKLAYGMLCFLS